MTSSSFGRAIHWANAVQVILPHSFSGAYANHYLFESDLKRMTEVNVTLILTVRDENLTDLMKLLALLRVAKDKGIEPKSVELHVVSATKCEKLLSWIKELKRHAWSSELSLRIKWKEQS